MVNMNGRLYDPLVGRFLSVDPYIQDPGFTQEYNRYSYCLNNPLRYTDPSGYKKAPVKEDAFIMDYANYWNRRMLCGGGSGGSGGPGQGRNGTGLGGVYYDWGSNKHKSTAQGNEEVGWDYAYGNSSRYGREVSAIIYSGSKGNPYQILLGFHYSDGSSFYYSDGDNLGETQGGGGNAWDYISNGASVASGYPTISGTWAYNTSGDVAWTGKNTNYYKLSQIKNNGGYVKSMNYAKNASRLTRGLGNGLTGLSVFASGVSTYIAVSNGTDNTSTWVNLGIGVGGAALTIFCAPAVVTGVAIGGAVWGIGQLVAGDEINGWIDNNFGY
ncbi:MAG: hypothetical protein K0M40_03390 [Prolixibacteraceae bacterium]|nr:hypothetical protein [Prolixibacteraceae bacterium]